MNILLQIGLPFAGMVMVLYALYSVFVTGGTGKAQGSRKKSSLTALGPEPQDKAQRLQGQIITLESELEKVKADYTKLQNEFEISQKKEVLAQEELRRRQDWVAKSEGELNKVKAENVELQGKFAAKEKELQEGFNKNVNLERKIRELNERALFLERETKEKSDQIESLKHQIEKYIKEAKQHQETLAELKKKEEISEWVPKQEFNKLNAEYTELEKELEEKEERLKSFAQEIMQLRNQLKSSSPPEEPIRPPDVTV